MWNLGDSLSTKASWAWCQARSQNFWWWFINEMIATSICALPWLEWGSHQLLTRACGYGYTRSILTQLGQLSVTDTSVWYWLHSPYPDSSMAVVSYWHECVVLVTLALPWLKYGSCQLLTLVCGTGYTRPTLTQVGQLSVTDTGMCMVLVTLVLPWLK